MTSQSKRPFATALKGSGLILSVALWTAGCAGATETTHAVKTPTKAASVPAAKPLPSAQPQDVPPQEVPVVIDQAAFEHWLRDMRKDALAHGISAKTVSAALGQVKPVVRVLELDRRQPEFTQTLGRYLASAVSDRRIRVGQAMLARHGALLRSIADDYGVQPRFLVAFWGLETNFGSNFGGFPVVDALATLAYDDRRSAFFRNELMKALEIIDAGHITRDKMLGSWAGAMGNLQFMPSTFRAHAVDRDGDGRIDIWGSLPDTFASAAKYLSDEGWKGDETWGREVLLPAGFDYDLADLSVRKPLSDWAAMGIREADGSALPSVPGMQASVLVPAGASGPAFVVYDNFRTIMIWNRSTLYALAIGYLSDRLVDKPALVHFPSTTEQPLRRSEIFEMQSLLNGLGFDAGKPDGLAGSRTRAAVKAFQKSIHVIPDGYPSPSVLVALRKIVLH